MRETLLLVAVEGLSYEQAAEIIGVPLGTVRSRLHRARHALLDMQEGPRDGSLSHSAGLDELRPAATG